MTRSIRDIPKKAGRPKTTGRGEGVFVRFQRPQLPALDAWIDQQPEPKPSRPEAIRIALRDWLTGLGLLKAADERENRH